MNHLSLGFTHHYYLYEIAIEVLIFYHQSDCKSDAMSIYSVNFLHVNLGFIASPTRRLVSTELYLRVERAHTVQH